MTKPAALLQLRLLKTTDDQLLLLFYNIFTLLNKHTDTHGLLLS